MIKPLLWRPSLTPSRQANHCDIFSRHPGLLEHAASDIISFFSYLVRSQKQPSTLLPPITFGPSPARENDPRASSSSSIPFKFRLSWLVTIKPRPRLSSFRRSSLRTLSLGTPGSWGRLIREIRRWILDLATMFFSSLLSFSLILMESNIGTIYVFLCRRVYVTRNLMCMQVSM